jgi:radical SAM protein with 4Fe4S-binding SPASM domain
VNAFSRNVWTKRAVEAGLLLRRGRLRQLVYKVLVRGGLRHSGLLRALSPLPVELMIEPVNACNLSCPTCPTGQGALNRPRRAMTLPEFKKIVDGLNGASCRFFLWNYGEPLLNRDLPEMVRYAGAAGISCRVSTNGELLVSQELCRELVASGLEHLIVCVDGADAETHARFRRGSDYAAVIAGLRNLFSVRRAAGSSVPAVELQFLVMRHNARQRHRMRALARELGADIYSEKAVGIDCNAPEFQRLAAELVPEDTNLGVFSRRSDGAYALKGELRNGCRRLVSSAVINSDGSVVPCCYDLRSEHVMGNVFEQGLAAIWAGEKYEALRRRVAADKGGVTMCRSCMEGRADLYVWRKGGGL